MTDNTNTKRQRATERYKYLFETHQTWDCSLIATRPRDVESSSAGSLQGGASPLFIFDVLSQ